jgi:hypothetical protein
LLRHKESGENKESWHLPGLHCSIARPEQAWEELIGGAMFRGG